MCLCVCQDMWQYVEGWGISREGYCVRVRICGRSVVSGPSHTLSPPDLALIDLDLDPKDESDTEGIEANTVSQFIVPGSTPKRIWGSMKRCITCNMKML